MLRSPSDLPRTTATSGRTRTALACVALSVSGCAGAAPMDVDSTQQAVLGGYVDDATSGVVGLGVNTGHGTFLGHCSGALIAPNLVLTARHCVSRSQLDDEDDVVCGESSFGAAYRATDFAVTATTEWPEAGDDAEVIRGAEIRVAPGGNDLCGYDVALLVLERSFPSQEATPLIPRIDESAQLNELFSAAGYGLTSVSERTAGSGVRMRTDDRSVGCTAEVCDAFPTPLVPEKEWLSTDANICSGDSGGPALDAEGRVIGVASRGPVTCETAVYGDVAVWADFIIEVALSAAQRGGYDAPHWTTGDSTAPATPVLGNMQDSEASAADFSDDLISSGENFAPDSERDDAPEEEPQSAGDCSEEECGGGLSAESGCAVQPVLPVGSSPKHLAWLALVGLFVLRRRR